MNFGSILIFARCVVDTCKIYYVGEFFLNERGPVLLFIIYIIKNENTLQL